MQIKRVPITRLNPAAYNPRKDLQPGDPEYQKLARSMTKFGCVEPIIWNERTGNVVGGHQRLKVLIAAGETELDVSVVNLSAEDEKALNLALNKIAGVWDDEALSQLLQELAETAGVDETLTGFDPGELDELLESLSGVTAGFALPGADAYVNSFFESGAQEKSRKESEPAKAAPVSMEEDRAADMSGSILVYGLTPDRLEVLTGYLAENGYTCGLSGKWHLGDRVEAGGA